MRKNKLELVNKIFIYSGSLVAVLISFCFALPATILIGVDKSSNGAKMISWMFGINGGIKTFGMSMLFILQCLIAIFAILFLVLSYFRKFSKKEMNIYLISIAVLLLICIILSFLTKVITSNAVIKSVKDKLTPEEYEKFMKQLNATHNGLGPILYSSLGLFSLLLIGGSIFISNYKFNKEERLINN